MTQYSDELASKNAEYGIFETLDFNIFLGPACPPTPLLYIEYGHDP